MNVDALTETAVAAIMRDVARTIVLPAFNPGQAIAAEYKTPGEAVTETDRACEEALSQRLAALIPGVAIIGEEAVHGDPSLLRHLEQGTTWIIDPIDGTGNFAAGTAPFGILVALAEEGLPIAGWILDPLTDRMCSARAGCGARIDGETFRVTPPRRGRPKLALTRLFANPERRDALAIRLRNVGSVEDAPRCAADVYPRVATGDIDAALFTRTIAWDHAAGIVFLEEAGGRAARPDGGAYRCHDPAGGLIAACDPAQFDVLAALVAEVEGGLVHLPA